MIANLLDGARFLPQEKIIELMNQIYEISNSQNIPPAEVPAYINRKIEEKARLDAEIQKSRAILDQEDILVQTIEEFKKLKEELNKRGISIDDPRKFASVLQTINRIGYAPPMSRGQLMQIDFLNFNNHFVITRSLTNRV